MASAEVNKGGDVVAEVTGSRGNGWSLYKSGVHKLIYDLLTVQYCHQHGLGFFFFFFLFLSLFFHLFFLEQMMLTLAL